MQDLGASYITAPLNCEPLEYPFWLIQWWGQSGSTSQTSTPGLSCHSQMEPIASYHKTPSHNLWTQSWSYHHLCSALSCCFYSLEPRKKRVAAPLFNSCLNGDWVGLDYTSAQKSKHEKLGCAYTAKFTGRPSQILRQSFKWWLKCYIFMPYTFQTWPFPETRPYLLSWNSLRAGFLSCILLSFPWSPHFTLTFFTLFACFALYLLEHYSVSY